MSELKSAVWNDIVIISPKIWDIVESLLYHVAVDLQMEISLMAVSPVMLQYM